MSLVYSTDAGRMCPACRKPLAGCQCKAKVPAPAGDGIVRVSREKQGRAGKLVTVVRGMQGDAAALSAWGKTLRTDCGAGGMASMLRGSPRPERAGPNRRLCTRPAAC